MLRVEADTPFTSDQEVVPYEILPGAVEKRMWATEQ